MAVKNAKVVPDEVASIKVCCTFLKTRSLKFLLNNTLNNASKIAKQSDWKI